MILDNLYTTHCDYGNMDARLARAFEWLKVTDLKKLDPNQTIVVDGGRIKALIQSYTTKRPDEATFETHRAYIDIQMIVSGREYIMWAPQVKLTQVKVPYDYEKDIVRYADPEIFVPIRLEAGDFCVLFPTDGHKPTIMVDMPTEVKKIVVKVAV